MRGRYLMAAALLVLTPAFAQAGDVKVTLREAVERALAGNHLLKASGHELAAAERATAASRGDFFPRVSLAETGAVTNTPTRVFMMKLDEGRFAAEDFQVERLNDPGTRGDFQTLLTLDQPLFDLSVFYGSERAGREEAVQRAGFDQRREDVAMATLAAWLEVRRAAALQAATEEGMKEAREHRRLAAVRAEAGAGLKSDLLRASVSLGEMEQQAITAANDSTIARLRLAQVVGEESGSALDIAEGAPVLAQPAGLDALTELALAGRPDLREAAGRVELAETGVRSARSAYYPTLRATAAYQMNDRNVPFGRDHDSWAAGATLRWDLFDGLKRGNELEKARSLRAAAAEQLEEQRREARLQLTGEWLRRREAEKRQEVARASLRDAEETVRLVGKRYENSLATMADLLDAQSALNRTRSRLVESENATILATARLYHAAGVLTTEVLK